jgi:hypothetical protein
VADLETNRDLYRFVTAMVAARSSSTRSLDDYLRAMLRRVIALRGRPELTPREFVDLVIGAFDDQPLPFELAWSTAELPVDETAPTQRDVEHKLVRQIVDVRELAAAGAMRRDDRYFGVDAPRGNHWTNFDPATFVECGMQGAFGGWSTADETGRRRVVESSPVDSGSIVQRFVPITHVTWEDVLAFLRCGQEYE